MDKKKNIIMISVAGVLLLVAVYLIFFRSPPAPPVDTEASTASEQIAEKLQKSNPRPANLPPEPPPPPEGGGMMQPAR